MLNARILAVGLIFAAQGLFVYRVARSEQLPPMPELQQFPSSVGNWTKLGDDPIDAATLAQLQADRVLSWNYMNRRSGAQANWFVAWFQTQTKGAQPHSPKVCLPGSGWIPQVADAIPVDAPGRRLTVNRYIISQNGVRAVVLYWFETPRRSIANEWAAKFWLVADAVRDHRTDTAMARVVVYQGNQTDAEATAAAVGFVEKAYAPLRQALSNPVN